MIEVTLVTPETHHASMCLAFVRECIEAKTEMAGTSRVDEFPYDEWLEKVHRYRVGRNLEKGYVQASTFLCVDQGRLIGFVNIRHELNAFLLKAGGHIGYMVRPSERRKGYAKAILKAALDYCLTTLECDRILVTCNPDNEASRRTIIHHGGQYENTVEDDQLGTVSRYWINLKALR